MTPRAPVSGAELFTASAQRVVDYLTAHTPLADWSVSRVAGGEQVHLHVHHEDFLTVGQRRPWDETFCVRMSRGAAQIVPDSQADPDYADHPDAEVVRAYAGIPIVDDDGRTFGTLCGVGVRPLPDLDAIDVDLVRLMGELLSAQLATARVADRERRSAEIAEALASTDALTGLVNRRGWDIIAADAQERVDAFGDPVAVAVIDLDGLKQVNDTHGHAAGDALLRRAAEVLRLVATRADRVARIGGDEFAVLANNVAVADLEAHFGRFVEQLGAAGVSASLGHAATSAGLVGVTDALGEADARMYRDKERRRAS